MNAIALKKCQRCRIQRPPSAFARKVRAHDGLQPWCKDCDHTFKTTSTVKAHRPRPRQRTAYKNFAEALREIEVCEDKAAVERVVARLRETYALA